MKRNLIIITLFACVIVNINAYNQDAYDKLKKNNQCSQGDLSEANLKSALLAKAILFETNLKGADLSHANITEADLSYTNLAKANLSNSILTNANLSGAVLTDVNLTGAYLYKTDLTGADCSGAKFDQAFFDETIMPNGSKYTGVGLSDNTYLSLPASKFLMPIEDVFITEQEIIPTGKIARGVVKTGEQAEVIGLNGEVITVTIKKISQGKDLLLAKGQTGDNVGLSISGISKNDIRRGCVIAAPGSVTPHKKFICKVYVKTKSEGGTGKGFFEGYRPQFFIRTIEVTGTVKILKSNESSVNPGDTATLEIELVTPIALEKNLPIFLREGGRNVASGKIIEIIKDKKDK